jgi:tripartite-type tricarboxylate transporter receptor subunit TctC
VARLSRELIAVLSRPEIREQVARQGAEPQTSTPAELAAHTKEQYQAWSRVIRETGIPQE